METKICRICGIEKEITEYSKSGKHYRTECKKCHNSKMKEWRNKNTNYIKEYEKIYKQDHKEHYKKVYKDYYERNKKHILEYKKQYKNSHREYYENYSKEYNKKYYIKNVDKIKAQTKEYSKKRKNIDNLYKLKCNIRNLINCSFNRKNIKKDKETEDILGCSIDFFIKYLLQTFKNNYGIEWDKKEKVHIDHIIPLASANNEKEVIKLCHYSNLQLLKAKDNLKKGSKTNYVLLKGE